jgi:hypothetical protein
VKTVTGLQNSGEQFLPTGGVERVSLGLWSGDFERETEGVSGESGVVGRDGSKRRGVAVGEDDTDGWGLSVSVKGRGGCGWFFPGWCWAGLASGRPSAGFLFFSSQFSFSNFLLYCFVV